MSLSFRMSSFLPSILISVPAYLANRTVSPTDTSMSNAVAVFVTLAWADRQDFTLLRLLFGSFRKHDTASGDFFLLEGLDHHTASQGFYGYRHMYLLAKFELNLDYIQTS